MPLTATLVLSGLRSVQRVEQRCVDDPAIMGQQRRAEHPSGRHEDAVCRIAVKRGPNRAFRPSCIGAVERPRSGADVAPKALDSAVELPRLGLLGL